MMQKPATDNEACNQAGKFERSLENGGMSKESFPTHHIFLTRSVGRTTSRDFFVIGFTKIEIEATHNIYET